MDGKYWSNQVYLLVGGSFLVMDIPMLLKLILTPDRIGLKDIGFLVLLLSLAIHCFIQGFEKICIYRDEVCLQTVFETTCYTKMNYDFQPLGKINKRSLAGSAYCIAVVEKKTGKVASHIYLYSFAKKYHQIIEALSL